MAHRVDRKAGEKISRWRLKELLGTGGNAEVWTAADGDGSVVALKILRQIKPQSEPYQRMRSEVSALEQIGAHPGVLPLLESSLPEHPSKSEPAWLATPVAVPIREALAGTDNLRDVVSAVASVANTLASLAKVHGIYHRDIKPENLYRLGDDWVVGDFGLVTFPDKESVTAVGRLIGPTYYLAPEMFRGDVVDPGPADVYALAKTLWVLASGQSFPMPGHLSIDTELFRLSGFTAGEGLRHLDILIDRSTRVDPRARPSMIDIKNELQAWLAPSAESDGMQSVSRSVVDQVAPRFSARKATIASYERRKEIARKIENYGRARLQVVIDAVAGATGLEEEHGVTSFREAPEVAKALNTGEPGYPNFRAVAFHAPRLPHEREKRTSLVLGLAFPMDSDNNTHWFGGFVLFHDRRVAGTWLTTVEVAPAESALSEEAERKVIRQLEQYLDAALLAFVEYVS